MATIELTKVAKRFGDMYAVRPLDLRIGDGEFVALLGPSGCGKTTTLRMIAGLETTSEGAISINGQDVTRLPPSRRDIAMVFQFFALYPHLSVRENIAFPLKAQGVRPDQVQSQVTSVAQLLQIQSLLRYKPPALSSGDQQRVSLARALVRNPACFLMDEPLGALDADFRETMRSEIKKLMLTIRGTTVYVTHDQIEAMAMADRIVVMSQGAVQQIGTPAEVYHSPQTLFVARFIGSPGMNLLEGEWRDGAVHFAWGNRYAPPTTWQNVKPGAVVLGFRPESVLLDPNGALSGTVYAVDLHGSYTMAIIDSGGQHIHARVARDTSLRVGESVRLDLRQTSVCVFDPKSEQKLNPIHSI
jgi:multiple sugar transport system ATP-binding protein